ncbi:uncharacterized protein LOC129316461 [Prosopis cineraria]|uniref:uncharacterized protein LOC129316461 n=1 Tax=Prosopis cineraria TaxID=364024 RepID=UPI00240FC2C6|nr:uncharacterized protein LOC129316461 [Prosopis cineraria]
MTIKSQNINFIPIKSQQILKGQSSPKVLKWYFDVTGKDRNTLLQVKARFLLCPNESLCDAKLYSLGLHSLIHTVNEGLVGPGESDFSGGSTRSRQLRVEHLKEKRETLVAVTEKQVKLEKESIHGILYGGQANEVSEVLPLLATITHPGVREIYEDFLQYANTFASKVLKLQQSLNQLQISNSKAIMRVGEPSEEEVEEEDYGDKNKAEEDDEDGDKGEDEAKDAHEAGDEDGDEDEDDDGHETAAGAGSKEDEDEGSNSKEESDER